MVGKIRSGKYIKFFIYLIAIVLLNLAGITLFFRLDLTQNNSYSISEASQWSVKPHSSCRADAAGHPGVGGLLLRSSNPPTPR